MYRSHTNEITGLLYMTYMKEDNTKNKLSHISKFLAQDNDFPAF